MKYFIKFILICILSVIFFAGIYKPLFAYVMSSGNYQIESDSSLSPMGGLGTSANYIFSDTMGQVSSGGSSSDLYKIKAGFQEMQQVSISVSSPGNTSLAPSIPGVSGGTADANTNWAIQTDNAAGFSMRVSALSKPALKLDPSTYFDDYSTTPSVWNIGSSAAKFGFTVVPADANDAALAFKDDGNGNCGTGIEVGHCWSGFNGSNTIAVINKQDRTSPSGENEQITFQAQSNKLLESGDYSAQITVTVSAN